MQEELFHRRITEEERKMSKGLSREEKRQRLLRIFHEDQEFYQCKDLEKIAKDKGLNPSQIKDLLNDLLDEELINIEKVASSLFYWSFPNKFLKTKEKTVAELRTQNNDLNNKLVTLEAAFKGEQVRNCANNECKMFCSTWFSLSFSSPFSLSHR
jgi:DNA-binding transcriptional MerR regulator